MSESYPADDWIYTAYDASRTPLAERGPYYRANQVYVLKQALAALEAEPA